MRVTLPSGVIIETTNSEAEWLLKQLLYPDRPKPPPVKKSHKKESLKAPESAELSPQMVKTWEWLVAHDDPNGIRVITIAEGLGITTNTVTWRCNVLIEKGLVHRLRRGRYRPGEAPTESPQEGSAPPPTPAIDDPQRYQASAGTLLEGESS